MLLAEGVHTTLADRDSLTALGHAIQNGHKEVAALLAQHTEAKLRSSKYSISKIETDNYSSPSYSTEVAMVTKLLIQLGHQLSEQLQRYRESKLST